MKQCKIFSISDTIQTVNDFCENKDIDRIECVENMIIVYYNIRKVYSMDVSKLSLNERIKFLNLYKKVTFNYGDE